MIEIIETTADAITPNTVRDVINRLRREQNMPRKALEIEADLSSGALYCLESGRSPNLRTLCKILDVLGYELTVRSKR